MKEILQGKQKFEPKLFYVVDLEKLIAPNHLLRKIKKILDLSLVRKQTKRLYCQDNGRPSIDPEMFFRMQILAYIYGIPSDRQLCDEIQVNMAYRWFLELSLEDEVPDHSSLTRIRDRLGVKIYKEVFERIVVQCQKAGLVPGKRIISDATLIEADANLDSMVEREEGDSHAKELKLYQRRYHDFRKGKKQRKISNQTHVSQSDPDSTLVSRTGSYRKLCYKAHHSIDAKARVITDCYVTTGNQHECQVLPDRIDYQRKRFGLSIQQVIADKGYGRGPTYGYFRKKEIRTYIPLHSDNLGEGKISRGEFHYDRKNDRYRCPKDFYLYPYEKRDRGIKRYRMVGGHCRKCPLRSRCLPENFQHRARFIFRSPYQDEIDKVRKRQSTSYFKSRLRERKWKVEGIFGEAKQNHGLRRARYRGLQKVQIQVYMISIVQNLKRLAASFIIFLRWRFGIRFATI